MMIQISSKDTLYMYNLYHIVKAFFPNEEISQNLDEKQESLVSVKLEEDSCFYVPVSEIADCPDRQDGKKKVTKIVYDWLSKVTGFDILSDRDDQSRTRDEQIFLAGWPDAGTSEIGRAHV